MVALKKKKLPDHRLIIGLTCDQAFFLFSKGIIEKKNLSLFKAELKKYFCPSFPENKIHSSMHHTHIRFKF